MLSKILLTTLLTTLIGALVTANALAQSDEVPMLPTPTATPAQEQLKLLKSGIAVEPTNEAKAAQPPTSAKSAESSGPAVSMKPAGNGVISITKIVGEVGDQFVTSREVKINSAVDQALEQKPVSTDDGYKILTGTERIFPAEVGRVLDEWAVYFEARSLGSTDVQKADVTKAIGVVEDRWSGHQAWKDLEVGPDELRQMVERRLAAENFQKLKSDPALSPVSDDEALSYYKKNRLRFGSLPFSNFQENIKAFLVKTQVEKRLGEWHEVLRRKYKTRNFISG